MTKLTYSLVYTPSLDNDLGADERDIKYVCSDNKIHIRLRDYDKPEVIQGFIGKLTFLLTYLVNSVSSTATDDNPEELIDSFCAHNDDYFKLVSFINSALHEPKFKGILITKTYRKKDKGPRANYFGNMPKGVCPLVDDYRYGDLNYFLSRLNMNLYSYLFNDGISIQIHQPVVLTCYDKFARKISKKPKVSEFEYVNLFEQVLPTKFPL